MFLAIILYSFVNALIIYIFYKWATKNQDYFVRHRMKHLKPNFLVGNTLKLYLNRYPSHIFMEKIYNSYPNEKLVGFFDFRTPTYMVCDADVMNQIGISKFDHFVDRIPFLDIQSDTLFGKSVILMCGNKWRAMRSTLAPAFTGSKLRNMFESFVGEIAPNLIESLIKQSRQSGPIRCEMLHFFGCFSADVGASVSFGLEINSFKNPTNKFLIYADAAKYFAGFEAGLRVVLLGMFPQLMRAIDFEFVPQCVKKFFKSSIIDTMNERTSKQIFRPDIVNTLMEIRNERLQRQCESAKCDVDDNNCDWTDDELVAQCFVSFFVTCDSVSNVLAFMSYELALNQNVQEKLYQEIRTISDSLNGGQLTYDAISTLKYLDQVMNETLRKWPTALLTTRKCTKDVVLDLGDGKTVKIERGMGIWIPISAIHNDPKNFENPSKLDPDRFSDENKSRIKAGSFIPFGIGPRSCLAPRFGQMVLKSLMFYLLLNFSIQPYEKTEIPLKFSSTVVLHKPKNGIHLEFRSRS